jgi:hypothetical protein
MSLLEKIAAMIRVLRRRSCRGKPGKDDVTNYKSRNSPENYLTERRFAASGSLITTVVPRKVPINGPHGSCPSPSGLPTTRELKRIGPWVRVLSLPLEPGLTEPSTSSAGFTFMTKMYREIRKPPASTLPGC